MAKSPDKANAIARAFRLYVTSETRTYDDVAAEVGLSVKEVQKAGAADNWVEQRQRYHERRRDLSIEDCLSLAEQRNAALGALRKLYAQLIAQTSADVADEAVTSKAADAISKVSKAISVIKGDAGRLEPLIEAVGRLLSAARAQFDDAAYATVADVASVVFDQLQEEYPSR